MSYIIPGQSVLTVGANKETFYRLSRERIRSSFGQEAMSGEVFKREIVCVLYDALCVLQDLLIK